MPTHEVFNQAPPSGGDNLFTTDPGLLAAVQRWGGSSLPSLAGLGNLAGSDLAQGWGREADANPPVLRTHDSRGARIDAVAYHRAYDELMATALGHGIE